MRLPEGYTEVEYIQFNNAPYIDTGLKLPSSFKMELGLTPTGSFGVIAGVQWSSPKFELTVWENNMSYCTANTAFTGTTITPGTGRYDLVCTNNSYTVNGATETKTVSASNSTSNNLRIGAHGSGEIDTYRAMMKLYYFRLYSAETLVRDFVPCINSSGTAGLYDLADGVFYQNSGTGAFTAGPELYETKYPLPAKYKLTEYTEADNAYIDMGYKPNNNTRLDVTYYAYGSASAIAACDAAWKDIGFGIWQTAAKFGSNVATGLSAVTNEIVEASLENGVFIRNDTSYSITTSTFQTAYNMYLFGLNRKGSAIEISSKVRIYSCRLYENSIAVRDFIPCINPSGEVGMWDTVNGVFYGNIGSGSFTPGAIIITPPDPPGNLTAESDNGTNTLTWDESSYADGYRVYENGVLIADTQQTSLTAVSEPYSANIYSVTAYNGDGESEPAVIRVYTSGSGDVLDDLITDRTAADVATHTRKGVYNASDLNRVAASAEYVHDILDGLGYRVPDQPNRAWFTNEIPDKNEIEAHHNAVVGLDVIRYAHEKVVLPPNLEKLTYERANNIEKFLLLCGEAAERIPAAYIYSDEIYGGELS